MELSVLQAHPPSPSAPLHSILAFDKAEGGDNSEMQEVSQLFLKAGREPSNATGTPVSGQLGLAMYGIFAPGICRSRFSSIHVYGASEVAVVMEGWCNRIDNCNLESSGSAIRVGDDDNANNVDIVDNIIEGIAGTGIVVGGGMNVRIQGNVIEGW